MPPHLPLARFTISSKLSCSCRAAFPSSTGPIAQLPTAVSCSGHYLYTSTTTSHSHPSSAVSFSTNPFHLKKGAPKAKKTISSPSAEHNPNNKAQTNRDRQIDPYDFSDLEAKIKVQLDWLREGLQKLRSGGRLSTETIEGFQVELKHGLGGEGGQGKKVEQVRLGELATVVPRGGRMIAVMVNEDAVCLHPFSQSFMIVGWFICSRRYCNVVFFESSTSNPSQAPYKPRLIRLPRNPIPTILYSSTSPSHLRRRSLVLSPWPTRRRTMRRRRWG